MHIGFICHEYPPCNHGGIGSFMKDLAEIIINEMSQRGKSVSVASIENTIGSIIRSAADITKLKSIGWHPQIDLLEGIAELINKN